MPRPSLPLGAYGEITTWQEGTVWVARAQFRDLDGVVRPVKRHGRSKAAAIRALKQSLATRQTPIRAAELTPESTFGKAADLFFRELAELISDGNRSPQTMDTYRSVYRSSIKEAFTELRLREITTPVVDRRISAIKKFSPSRARTAKAVISGIMRLATRHGAVAVNPTREIARIESRPKRKPRSLNADQRGAWLAVLAEDERAQRWDLVDLTLIMLATGCRIGECLALGWSDVDLDTGQAAVEWRLIRVTGRGLQRVPSTKTGAKGERALALPSWAVAVLRRRRALIGPSVEAVFPDSLGGWRDPSNVRKVWRAVAADAGITGLVTHTLRKTVASYLDDNGVPVRQISDQLGHARVSMTQDYYLGRGLADRRAADVLEHLFDPADGAQSEDGDKDGAE